MLEKSNDYKILAAYYFLIALYSVSFFYLRSYFHSNQQYPFIWISAAVFALLLLVTGVIHNYYYYKKPRGYLFGFLSGLGGNLIIFSIWVIFVLAGWSTPGDTVQFVLLIMAMAVFGLITGHFISVIYRKKRSIRGIDREEIFD